MLTDPRVVPALLRDFLVRLSGYVYKRLEFPTVEYVTLQLLQTWRF